MGKVQIWASQLWNNDFPPVCVMTGRPAETWKKFNFATPPGWAYSLLILVCLGGVGLIAFAIVMALVAQRASGYLPLTRSSSRTVRLAFWIPIGLLLALPVSWAMAIVFNAADSASAAAGIFFWLGFLFLFTGLVGRLVFTPLVSPRARVMEMAPGHNDRMVELRNVHPNFVAAVQQQQQVRAAQFAASSKPQFQPGSM